MHECRRRTSQLAVALLGVLATLLAVWVPLSSSRTHLEQDGRRLAAHAGGRFVEERHSTTRSFLRARSVSVPTGATAYWLVHRSPTTQVLGGALERDKHRVVRWGPGGLYAGSRRTYALFGFRLLEGYPGRMYDFHTQPNDVGGWAPPCSGGVAPIAIDYSRSSSGLVIQAEPENNGCDAGSGNYRFPIFTPAEIEARRGKWVWLWAEITWGRRELATKGALKVWVAGEDQPRVNVSGINTQFRGQNQITFWEGVYHGRGSPTASVVEIAPTRFGRTPEEAYNDTPVLQVAGPAGVPGGSSSDVPPRLSTEAVFFPVLGQQRKVEAERGCKVTLASRGRVAVRIGGPDDDRDTAVVSYRTSQRDTIVLGYELSVSSARRDGPLVVSRVEWPGGNASAELYVTAAGSLRLSVQRPGHRAGARDLATGVTVAPGRESQRIEVRLSRGSVTVYVDGRSVARHSGLDGPKGGEVVVARIGVERYDGKKPVRNLGAEFGDVVFGAS